MAMGTAAGSKLFIGTTVPMATLIAYAADTWVEVKNVEDLGSFGDQATEAKITTLGDRRTHKFKGSFDAGTLTVKCGSDPADAGQIAMVAAFASDLNYNFKVTLDDNLTNGGTPTTAYFAGKVMKKNRDVSTADNVVRQNFDVSIDTEILEAPAT